MAYVNIVNQVCASKAELFCRVRDFICKRNGTYDYSTTGIGWALFDSYYATNEDNPVTNDWFVIYSPGESGKGDLYYRFKYVLNFVSVHGFQSWDSVTHTGSNQYCTTNNWSMADAGSKTLWIYGDLDVVSCINKVTTADYDLIWCGKLMPVWEGQSGECAVCSSALGLGSDVSITVDAVPTEWQVGDAVFIRTTHSDVMATVKIEKTIIKTIVSNTITADLVNNYTSNCKLSNHCGYGVLNSTDAGGAITVLITDSGLVSTGASSLFSIPMTLTDHDPSILDGKWGMFDLIYGSSAAGVIGALKNTKCIPIFNAYLTHEDTLETNSGIYWRCFKCYSALYAAYKEV